MKKLGYILIGGLLMLGTYAFSAPYYSYQRSLLPIDSTENVGTSTAPWDEGWFNNLCLGGDCQTQWQVGGATSTDPFMAAWFIATSTTATSTFPDLVLTDRLLDGTTLRSLNQIFDATRSVGYVIGGGITDNGDGTVNVASGKGFVKTGANDLSPLKSFDWDAVTNLALTDDSINYIYYDYDTATLGVATSHTTLNGQTEVPLRTVFRQGNTVETLSGGIGGGVYLPNFRFNEWERLEYSGIERVEGGRIAESGTRYLTSTAAVFYKSFNKVEVAAVNTAGADRMEFVYRDGGGGWTFDDNSGAGYQQFSNILYDDGDGTPGDVATAKYATYYVYECLEGDIYLQFGQSGTLNLAQAITEQPPTPPNYLSQWAYLVGKIIILNGATNATTIENTLDISFTSTSPANHNDLSNLQGGTASEYYHFTSDQHTALQGLSSATSTDPLMVARLVATSTTATSTIANGLQTAYLNVSNGITLMGESFTNFTNYVRSRFSAGTGISISSGQISNTGVITVSCTSPLNCSGTNPASFTVNNAVADGSTKGVATFTANDFDSSSGLISIDYTNGQAASAANKGFLTAADWTTFNGKLGSYNAWTPTSYGAATSTTLGLLGGFISSASSTISAPLRLSSLSTGGLGIASGGLVYSGATTTAGTGLTYSSNAFNVNTTQNITNLSNLTTDGFVKTSNGNGTLSVDTNIPLYSYDAWTHPVAGVSATTSSLQISGTATSTFAVGLEAQGVGTPWIHATSTTATSTIAGGLKTNFLNVVSGVTLMGETFTNFTNYVRSLFTGGTGITITSGSIDLDDTAVAPGSYTNASITVDQQGRLTSASSGTAGNTWSYPFDWTSYGMSTTTTLGFLGGFISTASSTFSSTVNFTGTGTTTFAGGISGVGLASSAGLTLTGGNILSTSGATSTFANGLNLSGGCFAVNGVCLDQYQATWVGETPTGDVNNSNTDFELAGTPIAGSLSVYLNGVFQTGGGEDYTLSGTTITFGTAPYTGAVYVTYQTGISTWIEEEPVGDVNGVNTDFELAGTPKAKSLSVYLNGVFQTPGSDYTLSGTTITFTTAPVSGAVWVRYQT